MIRRSTWILLAVFAVLVGFAFFFQRYQANKADTVATATPTTPAVNLYDLKDKQVNEIKIVGNGGDTIDLSRTEGSTKWVMAGVPSEQVDSAKIESASVKLFSMTVQEDLPQTPPLDAIGLSTPAYTITLTTADGTQLVTYVGMQTPVGTGYYVRVGTNPVVIVSKSVLDDVLDLLKTPPLLPTATPEVTSTETPAAIEPTVQSTPTP